MKTLHTFLALLSFFPIHAQTTYGWTMTNSKYIWTGEFKLDSASPEGIKEKVLSRLHCNQYVVLSHQSAPNKVVGQVVGLSPRKDHIADFHFVVDCLHGKYKVSTTNFMTDVDDGSKRGNKKYSMEEYLRENSKNPKQILRYYKGQDERLRELFGMK